MLQLSPPSASLVKRTPLANELAAVQLAQGVEQLVNVSRRQRLTTRLRRFALRLLALCLRRLPWLPEL